MHWSIALYAKRQDDTLLLVEIQIRGRRLRGEGVSLLAILPPTCGNTKQAKQNQIDIFDIRGKEFILFDNVESISCAKKEDSFPLVSTKL